jgi:anti-sigma factor RsiW
MSPEPNSPQDEAELHAYVDGRLEPQRRAAVAARPRDGRRSGRLVRAWTQQKDALRALHPARCRERRPRRSRRPREYLHSRAAAASRSGSAGAAWRRPVLLAFGAGWAGHAAGASRSRQWRLSRRRTVQAFAQQPACGPSRLCARGTATRWKSMRDSSSNLVQWLVQAPEPDLEDPQPRRPGYELVAAGLLPGDQGARAQFMYQNAQGERITLYVGRQVSPEATPQAAEERRSATPARGRLQSLLGGPGLRLCAGGQAAARGLVDLAESVYRQL